MNNPGSIIFVDGHAIKETDGKTTRLIAGSVTNKGYQEGKGSTARFNYITSFVQLDSRYIVAVDRMNQCLRRIDTVTGITEVLSGTCGNLGYKIGKDKELYRYPYSVIRDNQDPAILLTSDDGNSAIREYDLHIKYGGLFHRDTGNPHFKPKVLTQHSKTGDLYMTTSSNAILRLTYLFPKITHIAGSSVRGDMDGPLSSALFNLPSGILLIDEGRKIALSDEPNGKLRVLDLATSTTRSICSGKDNGRGLGDRCGFDNPYCILVNGSDFLIGDFGRITKIKGK